MRESVWEYIIPSPTEKEELWYNCTFVFDANVLLNLYRYTSNTRDTLLSSFEELKERIWLPHQVVSEFAKNRFEVIYETVEKYKKLETLGETFISQCREELRIKSSDESISQLKEAIMVWFSEQRKKNLLVTNSSEDEILEKLLTIFRGKVGTSFSEEKLMSICEEGKKRYENQIPPGFCDAKKEKDANSNNAYGDLIVWKQILEYASQNKKDIIFITHDQKKDWWLISKGRTVGPRIELRKEFMEVTGKSFYMYSMDNFLEHYSKHKGQTADQSVIDEVIRIEIPYQIDSEKRQIELSSYLTEIERNNFFIKRKLSRQMQTLTSIRKKYRDRKMPPEVYIQLINTEKKIDELQHQLAKNEDIIFNYHILMKKDD